MNETATDAGLVLDHGRKRVLRNGEVVEVTGLSFDLLAALMEASPEPLSNEELAERVWKRCHVTDHTVAQRVAMVRKALGDQSDEPRYVRTVRGRGYAFVPQPAPGEHTPPHRAMKTFALPGLGLLLVLMVASASVAMMSNSGASDTEDFSAVLTDPQSGATARFSMGKKQEAEDQAQSETLSSILVDRKTGAVRIDGEQRSFAMPVLAEVDGVDLLVAGVPEFSDLAASDKALGALCGLAADPSLSRTPVPTELETFMASPDFRAACQAQ